MSRAFDAMTCAIAVASTMMVANAVRADELIHLKAHEAPVENGKSLDMSFDETSRAPEASTVAVTMRSGGSVSSSMFILLGMCAVTRARGATFFRSETIDGDSSRYRVTFPDHADAAPEGPRAGGMARSAPPQVMSLEQCKLVGM